MKTHLSVKSKILLLIAWLITSFSQAQNITITEEINGIGFQVAFNEVPSIREGKGNIVDYIYQTDESKPGSLKLPSKTFLIAIEIEKILEV